LFVIFLPSFLFVVVAFFAWARFVALLRCSVVCFQGKKTKTTEKTKGNYQGNLLLLLLLLLQQQDCFLVLRFCVEGEVEVEEEEAEEEEEGEGDPRGEGEGDL
jgi:hypothetical protein